MLAWDWPNPIDWVTAPFRWIGDKVAEKVSDLLADFFNWIAGLLMKGVMWLFDVIWDFIDGATTPNLFVDWYANGPYAICVYIAVSLLAMTLFMGVADYLWHRDGSGMLRTVVQDLPKAMLVLTGLLTITTWGIELGDAISSWLMDNYGQGMRAFPDRIRAAADEGNFGSGILVVVILALVMMLVLLVVLAELVIREGFIYLVVAITAVMISLDLYRPTKGASAVSKRTLAGLIAAKPMICLCFAIAGASAGGAGYVSTADGETQAAVEEPGGASGGCVSWEPPGTPECPYSAGPSAGGALVDTATVVPIDEESSEQLAPTIGAMLAGAAIMLLAAFSPSMILKFFSAGDATAGAGGAAAIAGMANKTASVAAGAVTGGAGGAAAGAAAGGGGGGRGGGGGGDGRGGASPSVAAQKAAG